MRRAVEFFSLYKFKVDMKVGDMNLCIQRDNK